MEGGRLSGKSRFARGAARDAARRCSCGGGGATLRLPDGGARRHAPNVAHAAGAMPPSRSTWVPRRASRGTGGAALARASPPRRARSVRRPGRRGPPVLDSERLGWPVVGEMRCGRAAIRRGAAATGRAPGGEGGGGAYSDDRHAPPLAPPRRGAGGHCRRRWDGASRDDPPRRRASVNAATVVRPGRPRSALSAVVCPSTYSPRGGGGPCAPPRGFPRLTGWRPAGRRIVWGLTAANAAVLRAAPAQRRPPTARRCLFGVAPPRRRHDLRHHPPDASGANRRHRTGA